MTKGPTTTLINSMLDYLTGTTFPAFSGGMFLGLSTTDCGDDGSGITEVTGGTYARFDITAYMAAAASRQMYNDTDIPFNAAPGASWGTIGHWFVSSAVTGGTIRWVGELSPLITVGASTPVTIKANVIRFAIDQTT